MQKSSSRYGVAARALLADERSYDFVNALLDRVTVAEMRSARPRKPWWSLTVALFESPVTGAWRFVGGAFDRPITERPNATVVALRHGALPVPIASQPVRRRTEPDKRRPLKLSVAIVNVLAGNLKMSEILHSRPPLFFSDPALAENG
jgi:hypothetical protein